MPLISSRCPSSRALRRGTFEPYAVHIHQYLPTHHMDVVLQLGRQPHTFDRTMLHCSHSIFSADVKSYLLLHQEAPD